MWKRWSRRVQYSGTRETPTPDEGCLFAMKVCQKKEPGKKDRRKPPNSKAEPFILGFLQSKGGPFVIDLRYAFQAQDSFYLVTDYFSRGSLETLLKRRQVSLDSCVAAFAELVVALTFLHAHGVVHRDCKPSNVLIDDQVRFRRPPSLGPRWPPPTPRPYPRSAAAPLTRHKTQGHGASPTLASRPARTSGWIFLWVRLYMAPKGAFLWRRRGQGPGDPRRRPTGSFTQTPRQLMASFSMTRPHSRGRVLGGDVKAAREGAPSRPSVDDGRRPRFWDRLACVVHSTTVPEVDPNHLCGAGRP